MASWETRIDSSSGKSSFSRSEICSGLHDVAQRRSWRRPWRRPFQFTAGPTVLPFRMSIVPASRSCTYCRSGSLAASFATLGRLDFRSACHCAVDARYSNPPLRVAAFRRSSREIVDDARSVRRPISRTLNFWARRSAISSRSVKDVAAHLKPRKSGLASS